MRSSSDADEIIGIHELEDGGEVLEMDEEDVGVIEKELGDTSSRATCVLNVDADKWGTPEPKNSFNKAWQQDFWEKRYLPQFSLFSWAHA